MRLILSIFLGFPSSALAEAPFNEVEARLNLLAGVMNSRDYEIGLAEIHQLKVLHAACEIEKATERFPISCLELKKPEVLDCVSYFAAAQETEVNALWPKRSYMDKSCVEALRKRRELLVYKKTGRKIE